MICPTCGHECDAIPFPLRLRTARNKRGLSREQAAELLGYDFATIKRWEEGKITPRPANLKLVVDWIEGKQ